MVTGGVYVNDRFRNKKKKTTQPTETEKIEAEKTIEAEVDKTAGAEKTTEADAEKIAEKTVEKKIETEEKTEAEGYVCLHFNSHFVLVCLTISCLGHVWGLILATSVNAVQAYLLLLLELFLRFT
ncbi:hypothetical protein R1sor_015450 [Riccia sorocarpa]|uniref:Uncharacterized protein n=1 Tax=Riccia sorocarpa TaxID=122646 RepID=A0ABD3HGH5_9MARC